MSNYQTLAGGTFLRKAVAGLARRTKLAFSDPATIHQDFEQDVLERLVGMGGNAFGAPIVGVKCSLDGQVKIMIMGLDSNQNWRKYSMRFSCIELPKQRYMCDPSVVADLAYQILGNSSPPENL